MALGVRGRVLLLIAVAILPGIAATAYLQVEQARADVEQTLVTLERIVDVRVLRAESAIETGRQLLTTMAAVPAVRDRVPDACDAFFAEALAQSQVYALFGVIERDGWVSCSGLPADEPVFAGDRSYFVRAVATQDFAMGDYQVGRITGIPSVNFGYPLLDPDGDVEAVVFAALDLSFLAVEAETITRTLPGSTMSVVSDAGTIMVRSPDHALFVGTSVHDTDTVLADMRGHEEGRLRGIGLDGVDRLYTFQQLPGHPEAPPVHIAFGVPVAAVRDQAQNEFIQGMAIILFGGVAAFLLAWWVSERSILRRLQAIERTARRLAHGELEARTGLPPGNSDLDRMAATIDRMAEAFERLDKVKMDLINNTAHELATPLTSIRLSLTILKKRCEAVLDPTGIKALDSMQRNTERLARVVEGVVSVAKFQSGQLELSFAEEDLAVLARKEVEQAANMARRHEVDLQLDAPGEVLVEVDGKWIARVVGNYLDNALRFTPAGGTVRVVARVDNGDGVVEVQDTGQGFDPSVAEHLFKPFAQAHDAMQTTEGGVGLGLYMARVLVERHGGRVWCRSDGPGKGALFGLSVPLREDDESER